MNENFELEHKASAATSEYKRALGEAFNGFISDDIQRNSKARIPWMPDTLRISEEVGMTDQAKVIIDPDQLATLVQVRGTSTPFN